MVLVDTSTWIRFLSKRLHRADVLLALLDREEVAAHPFVYGELLIGDMGGRRVFLNSYSVIDHLEVVSHKEVAEFVRRRRLHGRGLGWIDAHLLASCVVHNVPLWSEDKRLAAVAGELKLAFSA